MGDELLNYVPAAPGGSTPALTVAAAVGVAVSLIVAFAAAEAVPVVLTIGALMLVGDASHYGDMNVICGLIIAAIGFSCAFLSVQLIAHANRLLRGR